MLTPAVILFLKSNWYKPNTSVEILLNLYKAVALLKNTGSLVAKFAKFTDSPKLELNK